MKPRVAGLQLLCQLDEAQQLARALAGVGLAVLEDVYRVVGALGHLVAVDLLLLHQAVVAGLQVEQVRDQLLVVLRMVGQLEGSFRGFEGLHL